MTVTTRFAPSPTGYLHIGSARTALFCWLYARHTGGRYILRIEDTDRERSTEEAVRAIHDGLDWLGLTPDAEPIYQTHRFDRYLEVVEQLLAEGKAYKCYCSKERLTELREQQVANKQKPRYDGHCRHQQSDVADAPYVVRFANPTEGEVVVDDLVLGSVTIANSELDDLIIARSDGTPTYNFTVVVDDWDMEITHVIRGNDHLNNTPRQINIFTALNAQVPKYAHIPMIHGDDGKKLSKRHGAVSVVHYRDLGYLPQSMLNYLVRLGWSHGDQEIFSLDEMIAAFDIADVNKAPATFDVEKLQWLNQHYMKTLPVDEVAAELAWHYEQIDVDVSAGPAPAEMVVVFAERTKTLREMAENSRYFYEPVTAYEAKASKQLKPEALPVLQTLLERFTAATTWAAEPLHDIVKDTAEQLELKLGKVAQPLRVALTGGTVSPPIDATLALMGRDKVLQRLQDAMEFAERN